MDKKTWKKTLEKGECRYYYVRLEGVPFVTVCVVRIPSCPKPVFARGISACHPIDDPPSKSEGRTKSRAKAHKAWFHRGVSLAPEKQDGAMLHRLALLGEDDSAAFKQMKKGKILGLYGAKLTAKEKKRFPDWVK